MVTVQTVFAVVEIGWIRVIHSLVRWGVYADQDPASIQMLQNHAQGILDAKQGSMVRNVIQIHVLPVREGVGVMMTATASPLTKTAVVVVLKPHAQNHVPMCVKEKNVEQLTV